MLKNFAHIDFYNESVASALLAIRKRTRLSEIPSEQKRTCVNETEKKNELTVSQSVRALRTILLCALYRFSFLILCIDNRVFNNYTIMVFGAYYIFRFRK
jgi:hypothetical protein